MTAGAARTTTVLLTLAALAGAVVVLRLLVGATTGLGWPSPEILDLRLLSAASAAIVGAALATSGVLLQGILRNPLASPWVLGLTAGASLGVVLSILVSYRITGVVSAGRPAPIAALAGGFGALGLVYVLAQRRGLLEPVTLVLVGVVVSVLCGAATVFAQQMLPEAGLAAHVRWTMGSISLDTPWSMLAAVAAATVVGLLVSLTLARALDAAALGDEEAHSVGVRLQRLRLLAFAIAGVLTAGSVLLAGPIAFVGLVAPHAVRLLAGPAHAPLLIGAALAGVTLMVGAETIVAAFPGPAGRMPVGVVTALAGGIAFIWLLRRSAAGGAP